MSAPSAITLDASPQPPSAGLLTASTLAVAVVFLAFLIVAFVQNRSVVHEMAWPGIDIQYRELAGAQTILDQGYGPDAAYARERAWYNPMATWVVAALSRLSGVGPQIVIARAGPYVNLVAPIALFALVAVLFDRFAALAAAAAFIFVVGTRFPFYYSATYSPWFAPENFGQAWMYASLAVASGAFDPGASRRRAAAGGCFLGATFLTHAAPAILCGAVWLVLAAAAWHRSGRRRESLVQLGVALGTAFVVSLPFTIQILWHYHLAILNQFPSQSPSDLLDLNELPSLARTLLTDPPIWVAAIALGMRARRGLDRGMRVVLALLGIVAILLVAGDVRLALDRVGVHVPAIVPAFHFFFYLMAVVAIGCGVAIRDLGAAIVERWGRRRSDIASNGARGGLLACGLTIVAVIVGYPQYRQRVDFTDLRREALDTNRRLPVDVVTWIRAYTRPDDVFLCADDASLYIVAPAGRKVVATNRYFSNPYVDWAGRDADRREMFDRLAARDVAGFLALAAKYGVRFVLVSEDRSDDWLRASGMRAGDLPPVDAPGLATLPGFQLVFRTDRFGIVEVPQAEKSALGLTFVNRLSPAQGPIPAISQ